ncbi:molybdopterin-dependent oxidoreductase [Mycobacterium sp. M1]|uniref:Molybdopterin-dependent oxidoreductase n=1 Tax=Mycolicibacter acidiphilus TaxID=2835306 RepID=A0ABS5RHX3_9MYCO|nr:molybdopterin-dependent oxidoreductase [Mycolicibacter acidiphilus]MBS9533898.1 molybdopterin-dependent oxidoreductase [Mycolicibacter acidiphilus]
MAADEPDPQGGGAVTVNHRAELKKAGDVVEPDSWAGGLEDKRAIAPRLRIGRDKWFNLLWMIPIGFVGLVAAVAVAKFLAQIPGIQHFMDRYPGSEIPPGSKPGIPAWVGWQHFFNLFLMMFIIRSGIQILCDHPRLYVSRNATPNKDEWLRIAKPVPDNPLWTAKDDSVGLPRQFGLPGLRHTIGLARWWHLGADVLWVTNGAVFYFLLFKTGHWRHLVPQSWDVFPNAVTVGIKYLSLNWPDDNGWVTYNSLQLLAYFFTVFVAAPGALLTGLGMGPAVSMRLTHISKYLSIQLARSLHFLILVYFLFFILVHVTLVFATDAVRNLNHMFASRDDTSLVGFGVFCVALVVTTIAWVAATPFTFRHPRVVQRVGYALIGPVQRLFEFADPEPGAFEEKHISPYFWHNGTYPETVEYKELYAGDFKDWRLNVYGLVEHPVSFTLDELKALPYHEQITQHFCIQGWSGVAKWGGVSMQTILDIVKPLPTAKWVIFYSLAPGADGGIYYDAHDILQMSHHLTMLAYNMNDEPLDYGHGAPLRLRNELQHGFKMVKWLKGIEFVTHFSEVGSGYGGYNEDHEYFGYRQTI